MYFTSCLLDGGTSSFIGSLLLNRGLMQATQLASVGIVHKDNGIHGLLKVFHLHPLLYSTLLYSTMFLARRCLLRGMDLYAG